MTRADLLFEDAEANLGMYEDDDLENSHPQTSRFKITQVLRESANDWEDLVEDSEDSNFRQ